MLFNNNVNVYIECDAVNEASAYYAPNNLCIYLHNVMHLLGILCSVEWTVHAGY